MDTGGEGMANGPKEQAYDEHISPLMTKIIALCKEHGIPVVAKFQLDYDEEQEGPLYCTTSIVPDDADPCMHDMAKAAYPEPPQVFAFTITSSKPAEGAAK